MPARARLARIRTIVGTWTFLLGFIDLMGLIQYWDILSGSPSIIVIALLRSLTLLGLGIYLVRTAIERNHNDLG